MAPTEKCNDYNASYSLHFTLKLSVQEVTGIVTGTAVDFLGPSGQKREILTRLPNYRFICDHFQFVIHPVIRCYKIFVTHGFLT
jgi:hypothetical protein